MNNDRSQIKEVISAIRKYKRFIIAAHVDPEGDSIGSQLALSVMLKKMGKEYSIVNQDSIARIYKFMPNIDVIKKQPPRGFNFDAVCILDCPVIHRIGKVKRYIRKDIPIINIDHHVSNKRFGEFNWVCADASSTGEMVFDIFKEAKVKLDKNSALYLYVAIVMDTGFFRYANTSYKTHEIVAQLLKFDINPKDVSKYLYESHSFNSRKLLALMLFTIKRIANGNIAWVTLTNSMFKKTHTSVSDAEDFVNYALFIEGVEVAVLFCELKRDLIKISFRSNGDIDVNKIASRFKGGGHRLASGCLLKIPIRRAHKIIIDAVKEELKGFYGR